MKKIAKIVGGGAVAGFVLAAAVFLTFVLSGVPTRGPRIGHYAHPRKALLVVDVQEDFIGTTCPPTRKYKNSDALIATINKTIEVSRARNYPVVYIRQEYEGLWARTIAKTLFGGRGLPGRPGTQIDKRVAVVSDAIFPKRIGDAFSNPSLSDFLVKNQVDELILTGLDAQHCVHATARGALNRGYKVTAVTDALALMAENKWDALMKDYREEGILLTSSGAL
ncbi:MAG TPA: cysteine hydrolase [Elusimicrobiota bacterium]|nr:cysteine hydrolase [Elusimicrobiota bacterium]